jgi:hypothetical protein
MMPPVMTAGASRPNFATTAFQSRGRSRRIRQIRREQRVAGSRQCCEGLTG